MSEAALPDVFLPYQQRFMAAIDTHPVVVVEKSRRTGFTWAAAASAALKAGAARGARGSDVFYMGYEKDMTREFLKEVATWAKLLGHAASAVEEDIWPHPDDPEKSITVFRIRFASGFEVVALPSLARALRGKQGLVIIDEAAFHDDLEAVITAALALRIWGSHVVIVSTHNGDQNPFNTLVNDVRAGRRPYHLMRLTFDEAIADGLYRRICLKTGQTWSPEAEAIWRAGILAEHGDKADQELHVIPEPSTGAFLPAALILARSVPGIPVMHWACDVAFVHLPEEQRQAAGAAFIADEIAPVIARLSPEEAHCFGWDMARSGDVTVFYPLAITRTVQLRTPFVVELRNTPFDQQQQILWWMIERLPRKRAGKMDASGLGAHLAETTVQKFGAWIEAVKFSEPWYREHMPPLQRSFQDGTIEIPRDDDILTDLRMLKLVRGIARVPDHTRDAKGQKRHGDAAIALALAHAASRAEPDIYAYQAAGRRPAPDGAGSDNDDQDRFEHRRLTA